MQQVELPLIKMVRSPIVTEVTGMHWLGITGIDVWYDMPGGVQPVEDIICTALPLFFSNYLHSSLPFGFGIAAYGLEHVVSEEGGGGH